MTRIYSNLKFLRQVEHLRALQDQRVVAPVHIRIKPYNHCNHNCWYCAYRVDNLQLGEDIDLTDKMPEEKMTELVEDIISMGVQAVTFSGGGEPLLYKTLPQHVRRLAEGGVKVATLTNGSNLKGKMADAFAECGTWVRVSLDAWDDVSYAKQRGVKEGEFSQLLTNLRNFSARNSDCVLGTSFIIGEANHAHVADVCATLKETGVNHVKLSGAIVSNEVQENNEYHRKIWDVVTAQIAEAEKLNDENFSIINHYHEVEERFAKSYTTCPFLMFLTVVGADQMVYTCQDKAFTKLGTLGSIKDKSFAEFWFSEENRERLYSFDPSKNCQHHCVAHAKNLVLTDFLSIDSGHVEFV